MGPPPDAGSSRNRSTVDLVVRIPLCSHQGHAAHATSRCHPPCSRLRASTCAARRRRGRCPPPWLPSVPRGKSREARAGRGLPPSRRCCRASSPRASAARAGPPAGRRDRPDGAATERGRRPREPSPGPGFSALAPDRGPRDAGRTPGARSPRGCLCYAGAYGAHDGMASPRKQTQACRLGSPRANCLASGPLCTP